MDPEEHLAWLALALAAGGRSGQWLALVRAVPGQTALAVVTADEEALRALGAADGAIAALRGAWRAAALRVRDDCARHGLHAAPLPSPDYPPALRCLADPPLCLFWRGAKPASLAPAVAVVGARRCTAYGERVAEAAGRDVAAAGIVVVSGLARGVDAAAHRGALRAGRTVAVLAGGLDRVYPPEHRGLAEDIVACGGALVSEQPPGRRPLAWLFPYRNRLVTGLADAVVVVEAAARSGSLASARHALDQGREVFAVPGPVDSPLSEGTNRLLGQGACVYTSSLDLRAVPSLAGKLEQVSRKHSKPKAFDLSGFPPDQAAVLRLLQQAPAGLEQLQVGTGLDRTLLLALVTALELDGLLRRQGDGTLRIEPLPPGDQAPPRP